MTADYTVTLSHKRDGASVLLTRTETKTVPFTALDRKIIEIVLLLDGDQSKTIDDVIRHTLQEDDSTESVDDARVTPCYFWHLEDIESVTDVDVSIAVAGYLMRHWEPDVCEWWSDNGHPRTEAEARRSLTEIAAHADWPKEDLPDALRILELSVAKDWEQLRGFMHEYDRYLKP